MSSVTVVQRNPRDLELGGVGGRFRRWDYVITCQRATDENQKGGCCSEDAEKDVRSRVEIVENLRCAGLITSTVKSQDGTQFVIRIGATDDRLEKHAEYIKLQLPTIIPREPGDTSTEEILGDYSAFVSAATDPRKRALFPKVFPSYCRQELIRDIIETRMLRYPGKYPGYDRGANIDINKNIAQGKILQCFPLHDQATVDELMDTWAKAPLKVQPIDRVREYFGEKIALYFSFIGFYTTWLWIPAFIGIGVYILQSVLRVVDTYITPIFMFMMMLWSTLFLEFWKRHNAAQALHWNVLGYEERERARPQFHGELQLGFYAKGGGWISLEDEAVMKGDQKVDRYAGRPIPENLYSTRTRTIVFYLMSVPVLAGMLILVCVVSLAVLLLRIIMINVALSGSGAPSAANYFGLSSIASGVNAVLNAVSIIILNEVYIRMAAKLTDLENHRTQSEYEDALIVKTFLFQFVNSYFTLFYIAFFKSKYPVCILGNCRPDTCSDNSCFQELSFQLLVIFGIKQLALQIVEVATPLIKYVINLFLENRRLKKLADEGRPPPPRRSRAEAEAAKPIYDTTFDDYNEIVIQFGYVILFVSAFPLAPLFALVNNLIEIRTDAFKLLRLHQRPALGRSEDIGTWYGILEALSVIGVVTNCFILGFTSESFATGSGFSITQRIWFAFIAEHALLIAKTFLAAVIPDRPGTVVKELAKKHWIKEAQIEAIEQADAGPAPQRSVHASMTADVDEEVDALSPDELEPEQ